MFNKILVTGGTGLVGTALNSIVDSYSPTEFIFAGSKDCDLTRFDETVDYVRACNPDAMIQLAALHGSISYGSRYPATLLRDNVMMDLNLLEAARINGVKKIALTLSTGMYPEDAPIPLKEEYIHEGYPHDSSYGYAFAKRLIDPSIRAYRAQYGLSAIGLITNGIFGENADFRHQSSVMLPALIRRFYENKDNDTKITIWGDGSPVREYTYAKDIARAFMWCLDNYDSEQILNIGSTEEHSVAEVACMIAEIMGVDPDRKEFDTTKPVAISRKSSDNSKFMNLSNFKYTPFREGLENSIKYFMESYGDPTKIKLD
ncbi:MAG: NAD-dependent epimerase/dehydratase family protein [SAR202 cluster bacterium]|nr:NAD-dependent epimerase/dehydratase family protein [SAR202 cluster bacterium]